MVVIDGDYRDEETLHEADVADAEAVAVLEEDDVGNVHAALAAQEANPDVRLVVRMFNLDLGHRLEELFHDGEVLSASVLAAPAFAHAALSGNTPLPVRVRDRLLEVEPMQQNGRRLAVDVREAPDEPERGTDAVVRQATSMARRTRARVRGALRLFDGRLAATRARRPRCGRGHRRRPRQPRDGAERPPDQPVGPCVMRLFSHDLATRAERTFNIAISRSVSALAAPAFVAAIVRRRIVATVPLGSRALAVADLPGAALAGRTVGEAEAELELRVLARDDAWWPPGPTPIEPDSRLLVLASREGLAAAYGTGR